LVFFDLLCVGDQDYRGEPFQTRRRKLNVPPATAGRSIASDWLRRFEGAGLDGVIAKAVSGNL